MNLEVAESAVIITRDLATLSGQILDVGEILNNFVAEYDAGNLTNAILLYGNYKECLEILLANMREFRLTALMKDVAIRNILIDEKEREDNGNYGIGEED